MPWNGQGATGFGGVGENPYAPGGKFYDPSGVYNFGGGPGQGYRQNMTGGSMISTWGGGTDSPYGPGGSMFGVTPLGYPGQNQQMQLSPTYNQQQTPNWQSLFNQFLQAANGSNGTANYQNYGTYFKPEKVTAMAQQMRDQGNRAVSGGAFNQPGVSPSAAAELRQQYADNRRATAYQNATDFEREGANALQPILQGQAQAGLDKASFLSELNAQQLQRQGAVNSFLSALLGTFA